MSNATTKHKSLTVKTNRLRSSADYRVQRIVRTRSTRKERKCICKPPRMAHNENSMIWSAFRENSQLCDGIIICEDGVKIKVHRVILSAVSSYFKVHFTNSLDKGSLENVEAKVNVSSEIFRKILDYAYTGNCTIEGDTVEVLLIAADQYHVLGVIQLCCRYILDQLHPTNCLGILRFARYYFCSNLEKESKRFVKNNFISLLQKGQEFDTLTINEVVELLEDDELNVKSEEIVYDAIRRWINVNPEESKIHLLTLSRCVRLGNLTTEFLSSTILKWTAVKENQECREYLMEVMELIEYFRDNSLDIDSKLWKPRIPYDILFAIGGWSAGSHTNFIETYDMSSDKWLLSVDTDNIPRAYHGVCTLNGCIYMIGGFDGNEHFNTVRCFDPINHKWSECACMYYPRCYVSVVMHDNKIYAMGGYNGRMRMSSAERYDPKRNLWELIKPMLVQRSVAGAAVLNDKIYVVGGFKGQEVMSSAEVYDTFNNQWTFIPHMLSPRSGVSLVAFKNTLYALGGFNGYNRLRTGEKFTPGISAGWTDIAKMLSARSNSATVILGYLIFVIGGFNDRHAVGSTTTNCVECYDVDTDDWFDACPMNLNRSALSACVLSGLPNARDYSFMGRINKEVGQGAGTH